MLTFHVITLFPELISYGSSVSIIGRGIERQEIAVKTYNPRDFCRDKYRKVDDTPYGGGAGMVLKPEPFFAAFEAIERTANSPVLLMTPQGEPFKQSLAKEFSNEADVTIICGHYEGFDERIRMIATHEVSLGDFVLTGGELPALIIIDAIGRLVPGVIGKGISLAVESFENGLLEGPQYTKPADFRGMKVPAVLTSGNHRQIERWRHKEALRRTMLRRPELLSQIELTAQDKLLLAEIREEKEKEEFGSDT